MKSCGHSKKFTWKRFLILVLTTITMTTVSYITQHLDQFIGHDLILWTDTLEKPDPPKLLKPIAKLDKPTTYVTFA